MFYKIKANTYILSKLMYTGMKPISYENDTIMENIIEELRTYFYTNGYESIFTIKNE